MTTAPRKLPSATSFLSAALIFASRCEDMPTLSGVAAVSGGAVCASAVNETTNASETSAARADQLRSMFALLLRIRGAIITRRSRAESKAYLAGTLERSFSQASATASDGARQSPRGESEPPEPTLGALGTALRLNWFWKKRFRNTPSHLRIAGRWYLPRQACQARNATFAGA